MNRAVSLCWPGAAQREPFLHLSIVYSEVFETKAYIHFGRPPVLRCTMPILEHVLHPHSACPVKYNRQQALMIWADVSIKRSLHDGAVW
jgi:hypothetical protein